MQYSDTQKKLAISTYRDVQQSGGSPAAAFRAAKKLTKIPGSTISALVAYDSRRQNQRNPKFRTKLTQDIIVLATTYVSRKQTVTRVELAKHFSLSSGAVRDLLRVLRNQGLLRRTRFGYRVVKSTEITKTAQSSAVSENHEPSQDYLSIEAVNLDDRRSELERVSSNDNLFAPMVIRKYGIMYFRGDVRVIDLD